MSLANSAALRVVFGIGAHGVVVKESEPSILRQAVRTVGSGGEFVDPCLDAPSSWPSAAAFIKPGTYGLTRTELQMLDSLPWACRTKIAESLDLSPRAVKSATNSAVRPGLRRAAAAAVAVQGELG